jgi:hypothetical protein
MIITISKWSYFKMLKKTLIASAIAAVSFGSMAADSTFTTTTELKTYAAELFGAGSESLNLEGTTYALSVSNVSGISAGNSADLTIILKNGTFGSDVRPGDFDGDHFSVKSVSGGETGSNTVTAEIEVADSAATTDGSNLKTTFKIVKLNSASLASTATDARVTADILLEPRNKEGSTTLPVIEAASAAPLEIASSVENVSVKYITASTALNGKGLIDKDDNTKFSSTDGDWEAAVLKFEVDGSGTAGKQPDGSSPADAAYLFNGAEVSFAGPFNSDDKVEFNNDAMTIAGNKATIEVTDATTINDGKITYTPAGNENLAPSAYDVSYAVSGKLKTTQNVTADLVASTSYDGQNNFATINAVPGATAADIMNIRLTNKSSKDSQVFFRIKNIDGTSSGTFQLLTLGGNETVVVTPAMLEEIGGAFTGRPNIEFSSAEKFQALAVMRSNGTLTSFDTSGQ